MQTAIQLQILRSSFANLSLQICIKSSVKDLLYSKLYLLPFSTLHTESCKNTLDTANCPINNAHYRVHTTNSTLHNICVQNSQACQKSIIGNTCPGAKSFTTVIVSTPANIAGKYIVQRGFYRTKISIRHNFIVLENSQSVTYKGTNGQSCIY